MSPGMRETLLSGEALANLLLPAPAAETRAEEEGIASAMPSSKQKKKRKSISSGGAFTAKKAKSKATKQRAADVQQRRLRPPKIRSMRLASRCSRCQQHRAC